jgi:lipopolysaccharide export system protein LptA
VSSHSPFAPSGSARLIAFRALVVRVAASALGLALAMPTTAPAEKADRDKPINIESDRLLVDDAKKISTFEGNVVVTQGTLIIRGDRMIVRQDANGFSHATAFGNRAYFKQKREGVDEYVEGWADRMEYDGKAERVELFVRAEIHRGEDQVRGNYISYDQVTEFYQVFGGGKKGATPGNPEGRVRAVMQPKPKDDKGKPAAPPPPGAPVPLKPAPALANPRE